MQAKNQNASTRSRILNEADHARLFLQGDWSCESARVCEIELQNLSESLADSPKIIIDMNNLEKMDTFGAWLITRFMFEAKTTGKSVTLANQEIEIRSLLSSLKYKKAKKRPKDQPIPSFYLRFFETTGAAVIDFFNELSSGVAFFGAFIRSFFYAAQKEGHLRFSALITQFERVTLKSIPIIILISCLVGGIITQQSILQLRIFGTAHFVADLMGILVLRELGVLIASIMTAGRIASSFAAELGAMNMREEIDAIRTMGIDPIIFLIIPRILALVFGLPILTFVSEIFMLVGGGIVAYAYGGVAPEIFLERLQGSIQMNTFIVGMVKAPFMALIIGVIACLEGLSASGSTESVGQRTTASVVKAIFMVIIVDGFFAMFFAAMDY